MDKLTAALNPFTAITHVIVAEGQACPTNMRGLEKVEVSSVDEAVKQYEQLGWVRRVFLKLARRMYISSPAAGGNEEGKEEAYFEVLGRKLPIGAYQELDWGKEVGEPRGAGEEIEQRRLASLADDAIGRVQAEAGQEMMRRRGTRIQVVAFEKVWTGNEAGDARAVLRGPPGSGKTTALRYLAYQFATGQRMWKNTDPMVPIFVRLPQWAQQSDGQYIEFAKYVVRHAYAHELKAAARKLGMSDEDAALEQAQRQVVRWTQLGRAVVLLDGMDEVPQLAVRFWDGLKSELGHGLRGCPVLVSCRTLAYDEAFLGSERFAHYELLGLRPEQQQAFVRAWFADEPRGNEKAQDFNAQLDAQPQLQPVAQNPLLLAIACYAIGSDEQIQMPVARWKLYDRAIGSLLQRGYGGMELKGVPRRELDAAYCSHVRPEVHIVPALQDVAWHFPCEGKWQFLDYTQVLRLIEKVLGEHNLQAFAVQALDEHVIGAAGLLQRQGDKHATFVHRSFQEYLAAWKVVDCVSSMASSREAVQEYLQQAGMSDADAERLRLRQRQLSDDAHELVAPVPQAFRAEAEGSVQKGLLAARLAFAVIEPVLHAPAWQEVIVFIAGLLEGKVDGLYQSAAPCASPAGDPGYSVAASEFVRLIFEHNSTAEQALHRDLFLAIRCLGEIDRPDETLREKIRSALIERIVRSNEYVREEALLRALTDGARHIAGENVIGALLGALGALRSTWLTPRIFGAMAAQCARPEVLDVLVEKLGAWDKAVRRAAAEALGEMAPHSATPEVLSALVERLGDADGYVRGGAAWALGKMAPHSATPEVIGALVERLRDESWYVREAAAGALGKMAPHSARPEVLSALVERLGDAYFLVRHATAEALWEMLSAGNEGRPVLPKKCRPPTP
ncbi:MAG: HEAT repeat domain-containing protein [Armatimonadetes bacterium]|nr:HEAT repeat domain-containing protein [Armatimonadota bacterium]